LIEILYKLRGYKKKKPPSPQEIHVEEWMYEKLGLKEDDEKDRKTREEACGRRDPGPMANECVDELVGGDQIPEETI
jgi:hypothetical protein